MVDSGSGQDGFDSYLKDHGSRLLRLSYLLVGDACEAEDLFQESMARLLLAWPTTVRRASNVDAYVRQVVVNTSRRRFRRHRVVEILHPDMPNRPDMDRGAFSSVEDRHHLASALKSLPPRQRQAVVLRYYEDLSEADVAQIMGCSLGTVKSQMSKAMRSLRAHPTIFSDAKSHGANR